MKFYLLIPVFFISFLLFPLFAFSQKDSSDRESTHSESAVDNSSSNDSFPEEWNHELDHEMSDTWPSSIHHESDHFQSKFFHMLFILGLLIGFMMLASWALKRMMKTKITHLNTQSTIKVLETRYLSPRATLYLVEIQNQTFLIAESPTTVTYLSSLPPNESTTPTIYHDQMT